MLGWLPGLGDGELLADTILALCGPDTEVPGPAWLPAYIIFPVGFQLLQYLYCLSLICLICLNISKSQIFNMHGCAVYSCTIFKKLIIIEH